MYTFKEKNHEIKFKLAKEKYELEEVKKLFLDYADSLNIDLDFQGFQTEVNTLPGKYSSPDGIIVLALVDGKSTGCIALRKISGDICEMKRFYVRDNYRGLGIGRKLIDISVEKARSMNYKYIRLDTLTTMKSAQYLYSSSGFYDIPAYTYNPLKDARFMELKLE
ncbi:GNAT family N-acetyltransferase [Clostridium luticellarii]|jgi:ribosomal protein S18 acetylase RimI-like enzyme|uniref:Acetyltransferase (GNAT) family protein n=1 Tax=Clostridium luticellarii TaxID=1691940 RepID=A0A2T0B2U8_9CLOT|nr:GNAT family N-acetyltransferase [Clostridium luticellarii]MCI1945009.1 GNAT family N-acetyltransferase [Clostridium luticellarii]MCI1967841.1 GNAT family N-acetyltransferase [Clostridium luticellarii]MCI1995789.1 GNAT family N-acetyltransferase [Clostridium luticellarii]MCI2040928.1 GNAT family N-acetyltransferase [Clostridium luticellarii]PRR78202.1 Acetyltransferase (GNAT) family protein [Clostridium luticellarii]